MQEIRAQICRCTSCIYFLRRIIGDLCVNSVKVSKEFQELFKKQGESMIDTYKREVGACENIIMVQKDNGSKLINGIKKMKEKEKNNIQGKDLIDLIKHKFKQLEKKLHDTLNDRVKKVKSNEPINKEPRRGTFASVIKENHAPDFRMILREEKMNEIEEERQQELRKPNIMIFGQNESNEVQDEKCVQNLINDVGIESDVKFITRIRKQCNNKIHPIKVVLESGHKRYLMMKGLANLKGKPMYEGISVTEDYTLSERSIIKKWAQKAKERNAKEPSDSNIIWRIKGHPSKGIYLKKTEKKRNIVNEQNKEL